jgi:hypothetical protein
MLHTVTKCFEAGFGVRNKVGHNIFGKPAAILVLQEERRIPVVQSRYGGNVVFDTGVDQIIVVVDSRLVDGSSSKWIDPRPRD